MRTYAPTFILFLAGVLPACGQASGTITGTVFDKTGAVVPSAQVTITHAATNQHRQVIADNSGQFAFSFLSVGIYDVLVEKPGFASSLRKGTELQVNTTVQLRIELDVRSNVEQVTVAGRAELVQATSTTLVQVVDQRRIQDLPLKGRNVLELVTLNAGVSSENAGGGTNIVQNVAGAVTEQLHFHRTARDTHHDSEWG